MLQGSMALPAQACALIGRFSDPRVAESALTLLPHLKTRGVTALLPANDPLDVAAELVLRVPEDEIASRADLVIPSAATALFSMQRAWSLIAACRSSVSIAAGSAF